MITILSNRALNTLLLKRIEELEKELGDCPKIQERDDLLLEMKEQLSVVRLVSKETKQ